MRILGNLTRAFRKRKMSQCSYDNEGILGELFSQMSNFKGLQIVSIQAQDCVPTAITCADEILVVLTIPYCIGDSFVLQFVYQNAESRGALCVCSECMPL
jgi:hypothetical protein